MLAALLPLFDENMTVSAYSLFSQRQNLLKDPRYALTAQLDGAGRINGLEVIESIGVQTISEDKEIFVPVNNVSIFSDIDSQCSAPHERIVLFVDNTVKPESMYIEQIKKLKADGYKLAVWKLKVADFEEYKPILQETDYVFLNHKKIDISKARVYFSKVYPDIKLIAGNIETMDDYDRLKAEGGYALYEGSFFRMPVAKSDKEIAPLKINYIELLNLVNTENFELTDAADIIGRDTALVIELLKIVNVMSRNGEIKTIRHAAAMLGQKELKKWIVTAVTKQMCQDKPSELTRISLIRAKFAENIAPLYGLGGFSQELFLMGLFSVIDIILDKPMEEALSMIKVSDKIEKALCEGTGEYGLIYDMIKQYENADWQEVSRQMILQNMNMKDLYNAYCDALIWYRDMFF